jgi:DNA-binding PadR family transcriptional regulator
LDKLGGDVLENNVLKEMEGRLTKHFLDVIVLHELKSSSRLSGYDIMELVHAKFGMLISSGTIYSLLYSLERKGLVEGSVDNGKRTYVLTDQGAKTINTIEGTKEEIHRFMQILFA